MTQGKSLTFVKQIGLPIFSQLVDQVRVLTLNTFALKYSNIEQVLSVRLNGELLEDSNIYHRKWIAKNRPNHLRTGSG